MLIISEIVILMNLAFSPNRAEFDDLFAITNLPISRFLEHLLEENKLNEYMTLLANSFNPNAAENVMCRNTLSVDYNGNLYDCDFNQMLNLKVASKVKHISEYNEELLQNRNIFILRGINTCNNTL